MSDFEDYGPPTPASPEMAQKLAVNRTGRLTPGQRRTIVIAAIVTLALLLCPLALIIQVGALALSEGVTLSAGAVVAGVPGVAVFVIFCRGVVAERSMFLPGGRGGPP